MSGAALTGAPRALVGEPQRPLALVVQAMGGQGGGVLVDWIVDLAEQHGWLAQSTSVPGVAQRTGATLYYIELFDAAPARELGREPVLALMPVPGEVDIVIAAEWMEAGRAMQRGLVTPDRTTLIASTHRDYATVEKMVPGSGIADADAVLASARRHARRLVRADMRALAAEAGSVISAALFGALAGCGVLPFDDAAFEATIERGGVGVAASLRAFRAGAAAARGGGEEALAGTGAAPMETPPPHLPARAAAAAVEPLRARIEREFPREAQAMLGAGLQRVLEFQDLAYGTDYLDRMAALHALAEAHGGALHGHAATVEAARWLAVAMAYDDVIRVADLKTRAARGARVRREVGAGDGEVVGTVEYFHPRREEVLGLLPAALAHAAQRRAWLTAWLDRRLARGRRVRTHTVGMQLMLQAVASLRRWRRGNWRHAVEMAHLDRWWRQVLETLPQDHALAVELIRCRRLIKGYSDTHTRGSSRFDRLLDAARRLHGRPDAAAALASLREAALADAKGERLAQRWAALGLAEPAAAG